MQLHPLKTIKYQLYLLQLENYELGRCFKLLWQKGIFPNAVLRKGLVWTVKTQLILVMSVAEHIILGLLVFSFFPKTILGIVLFCVLFVLFFFVYFFLFALNLLILNPLDFLVKKWLVNKAKKIVANNPQVKIIGVAGSYGKTTMKEVIATVLSEKFKVEATPESINTPVGIARWIAQKFNQRLEVAVIEMGEHYKGDIKFLCDIARPDIAVVTGINQAHLERMGSMENITATILEIVENSKPEASIFANKDDARVAENLTKYILGKQIVIWYGQKDLDILYKRFDVDNLNWTVNNIEDIGEIKIALLGEYIIADVLAAIKIGQNLGMSVTEIRRGILNLKPITHRLQPILGSQNVLVIDDSYNGNPDGFREAMAVLEKFTNRRKLCITPGLVEAGSDSKKIHEVIGRQLALVVDKVILIKNSVAPFIVLGLKQSGFLDENILWFESALQAHAQLGNILKPGDVILFQNDWGDQYL